MGGAKKVKVRATNARASEALQESMTNAENRFLCWHAQLYTDVYGSVGGGVPAVRHSADRNCVTVPRHSPDDVVPARREIKAQAPYDAFYTYIYMGTRGSCSSRDWPNSMSTRERNSYVRRPDR